MDRGKRKSSQRSPRESDLAKAQKSSLSDVVSAASSMMINHSKAVQKEAAETRKAERQKTPTITSFLTGASNKIIETIAPRPLSETQTKEDKPILNNTVNKTQSKDQEEEEVDIAFWGKDYESSWAGDESDGDITPSYKAQKERETRRKRVTAEKKLDDENEDNEGEINSMTSILTNDPINMDTKAIAGKKVNKRNNNDSPKRDQKAKTFDETFDSNDEHSQSSLDSLLTIDTGADQEEQTLSLANNSGNVSITNLSIDSLLTEAAEQEGIQVEKSTKTNGTLKANDDDTNATPKYHNQKYIDQEEEFIMKDDENQEENNVDGEKEDDVNTVDSGNNTTVHKKDMNKVMMPRSMRYQLMINPFKKATQEDFDEDENFSSKVRDLLILMCNELTQCDKEARIISWRNKKTFQLLKLDSFPEEAPEISTFFQGFRAKVRGDRRVYIKFAIHSPTTPFQRIEKDLQNWAKLYEYSITRCLIQSDNAEFIGWICYSSYFTEVDLIKRILQKNSDFEWGFKMIAVTDTDKHLNWNQRLKALGVYVPADSANVAINIITRVMEAEPEDNCYLEYIEKYLFVPPMSTIDDMDSKIAYKSFVTRHRIHNKHLVGQFDPLIKIDIDRYIPIRNNQRATLRHLILDIQITDPDNPLVGTPLFHSIDFTEDSEKQWFGNKAGPGGEGHIFTYYKQNEAEAKKMIRGLGVYLAKYYGSAGIRKCFEKKHWEGNHKWKYSSSQKRFITPQDDHMKNNLVNDHNRTAMDIMIEMELLNIERQQMEETVERNEMEPPGTTNSASNGESTQENNARLYRDAQGLATHEHSSSVSNDNTPSENTDISRALQLEELSLIRKLTEKDLDSLDGIGQKKKEIHDIEYNDDNNSTASSITVESHQSSGNSISDHSLDSQMTNQSKVKNKGRRITVNDIPAFFEQGEIDKLSNAEIEARLLSWFSHKKGQEKIAMESAMDEFIRTRAKNTAKGNEEDNDNEGEVEHPGKDPPLESSVIDDSMDKTDVSPMEEAPSSSGNTAEEP